jgi:predicted membrane protein
MGLAFLLAKLDMLGGMSPWHLWPLILVFGGLLKLTQRNDSPGKVEGFIVLGAGVVIQLTYLDVIKLEWSMIWPVVLIVVGIYVFWSTWYRSRHRRAGKSHSPSYVDGFVVMGGREDEVSSEFEGGEIYCVMGGFDLDLRDATIKDGEAVLRVRVIMGGVELKVPEDWTIVVRGTPILGAFENKTRRRSAPEPESEQRLIIDGAVVMGGVEIRN